MSSSNDWVSSKIRSFSGKLHQRMKVEMKHPLHSAHFNETSSSLSLFKDLYSSLFTFQSYILFTFYFSIIQTLYSSHFKLTTCSLPVTILYSFNAHQLRYSSLSLQDLHCFRAAVAPSDRVRFGISSLNVDLFGREERLETRFGVEGILFPCCFRDQLNSFR